MAQLFSRRFDRRVRMLLVALPLVLLCAVGAALAYQRSSARWEIGKVQRQPIDFRHSLHANLLGISCRYCHVGATSERAAGMPSVGTCMTCHSQIWRGTRELAPLWEAARRQTPIEWKAVSRLPAHARFHHGSHAKAGVTCSTCHGPVQTMAATAKAESLSMGWCLECHMDPASKGVRRTEPAPAPSSHRDGRDLTDCNVCHH